jgi:uncharacterized coiled-coil protein SlyX
MLPSNVAIVDRNGRPTLFFLKQWGEIASSAPSSLESRVTDLETDVAALQTTVTAQGASISSLVADVADLQSDLSSLTSRVSDNEIRAAFAATVGGVS